MNAKIETYLILILMIGIGAVLAIRFIMSIRNSYLDMKSSMKEELAEKQEMQEDEDNSDTVQGDAE